MDVDPKIVGGIRDNVVCMGFLFGRGYILASQDTGGSEFNCHEDDMRQINSLRCLMTGVVRAIKVSIVNHRNVSYGFVLSEGSPLSTIKLWGHVSYQFWPEMYLCGIQRFSETCI